MENIVRENWKLQMILLKREINITANYVGKSRSVQDKNLFYLIC